MNYYYYYCWCVCALANYILDHCPVVDDMPDDSDGHTRCQAGTARDCPAQSDDEGEQGAHSALLKRCFMQQ